MPEIPAQRPAREVTCPHCKRTFAAEPMTDEHGHAEGWKCPHCRLFVALDRAERA